MIEGFFSIATRALWIMLPSCLAMLRPRSTAGTAMRRTPPRARTAAMPARATPVRSAPSLPLAQPAVQRKEEGVKEARPDDHREEGIEDHRDENEQAQEHGEQAELLDLWAFHRFLPYPAAERADRAHGRAVAPAHARHGPDARNSARSPIPARPGRRSQTGHILGRRGRRRPAMGAAENMHDPVGLARE